MAKTVKKAKPVKSVPPLDPPALARRLTWVRRRLRFVTTFRGLSWLLVLVLAGSLLVGLIDWRLHLPALVRASALVGMLSGVGYIFIRHLLRPLAAKSDDLTLALRVEEQYPGLNDSLASTVEFLNEADKPGLDSPGLRQEAVRHALRRARCCDFGKIVNARGLRAAGLLALAASAAALAVLLIYPQLAQTAVARMVAPFSGVDWPRQTQLEMDAPRDRIGRNELFEAKGTVRGVVPETASVVFTIDGSTQVTHQYEIAAGEEPGVGLLTVRLEPGRAKNNFRFEVQANDAVYRSKTILVSPPPLLTQLDGRPSPLVHLDFPAYTDLPPQDLPDGSGNVEAVAGTIVTLRAAANRPLRSAWIEYLPEPRFTDLAAFLAPLGSIHAVQTPPLSAGGQAVWDIVPAQLEPDRQRFSVRFRPYASGMYALHFEDESGLGNVRLFELRVQPDPAPTVTLERPSPTRDILDLVPDADITLQASVTDPHYAVRSVYFEYRGKKSEPPQKLPIWDYRASGLAIVWGLQSFAGTSAGEDIEPLRLRPVAVPINQAVSLKRFRHSDGSALKEGDILTLQLCADDFDDVSVDKEPGRSHEVEIRIISRNALDVILTQEEARVQQDLVRLEKLQREAKQKVADTQNQLRKNGKLQPDDVMRLLDAEQQQQQIRERVGDKQEGLRSEVARILDTVKNNKLPRTGTQDRMQRVQSSLDRLAREELPQIEPRLTNARKEAENQDSGGKDKDQSARKEEAARQKEKEANDRAKQALDKDEEAKQTEQKAADTPDGDPNKADLQQQAKQAKQEASKLRQQAQQIQKEADAIRKGEMKDGVQESLAEARQHQEEVQKTLNELLKDLDSFASTAGIKGEAKSILEKQKQIHQETKDLVDKNLGDNRDKLDDKERTQLDQLAESQRELEERTSKLLNQMEQVRDKRLQQNDPETAKQLDAAIKRANEGGITGQMKEARDQIEKNRMNDAAQKQSETIDQLKKFVKELEDQRAAELDRLAKKLREKQEQLEKLAQEQERLQKKVQQAKNIADPKAREEELKKLAKRQKELKEETEDLARQLSRMRQNRAAQAASQAAAQMEQALKQLERGQDAEEDQEEALERLDEAQREVERTREEAEEELAREQAAKAAEEIKRLKQRHEALMKEAERIERAVLREEAWRRSLVHSLNQLGHAQDQLGDETKTLGEKKLAEARVFGRLVQKAAEKMKQASAKFYDRADDAKDDPKDLTPAVEAEKLQKEALRRLDQLLEALKQEPGMAMRPPGGGGGGGQGGEGGSGGGGGAEGLPPLIQYKLLKAMQSEINQKTEDFARQHPNTAKLAEKEKAELQAIRKEQKEVADLLDEIAQPPDEGEGGKP
jgi:hypothetical protein